MEFIGSPALAMIVGNPLALCDGLEVGLRAGVDSTWCADILLTLSIVEDGGIAGDERQQGDENV